MINRVRRKFTISAMIAMSVFTVLLIIAINVVNYRQQDEMMTSILEEMASDGGSAPDDSSQNADSPAAPDEESGPPGKPGKRFTASAQYGKRFFSVSLDGDGNWNATVDSDSVIDETSAESLAEEVAALEKKQGYYNSYKYKVSESDGGTVIYFLDCSTELSSLRSLRTTSIIIGVLGLIAVFLVVSYMAGKAVEPLKESLQKQKQFITDAGHELKTPVAVIATNMDVLKMDVGKDNEWIVSTQRQAGKLRKLINNLISLSKLDEKENLTLAPVSLSDAVRDSADTYSMMAEADGKKLTARVEENVTIQADEASLRQMLGILFENAVKYSSDDSEIEVTLRKEGKHAVFTTANEWSHDVPAGELDHLFDRFYRGDKSRNRDAKNSGYGLGLSIAQTAAQKNKGKLTVSEDEKGRIVFEAKF